MKPALIMLNDPLLTKRRLLCYNVKNPNHYFEAMVLEVSPSGTLVKLLRDDSGVEWGPHSLVMVAEVLADKPEFGQPSPCG
jgi:hypothetical protein